MRWRLQVLILCLALLVYGEETKFSERGKEDRRTNLMVDLISYNWHRNGWSNILCVGSLPNSFYTAMSNLKPTFTVLDPSRNTEDVGPVVPYRSNTIIIHCKDFGEFEQTFRKTIASPYWHPHSHLILYYDVKDQEDLPKLFMIFWFYNACNAIVVQYNDEKENMSITYYNPYISEEYKLANLFGCWKATKLGRAVRKFNDSFICVEGCQNITLHSKLRSNYLGTCIGFETYKIPYDNRNILKTIDLFEDKGKNLHGFTLRGYAGNVEPFLVFTEKSDGSITSYSRDGILWNIASEVMNFKIDLNASKVTIKNRFNFEVSVQQIYTFARREADIVLYPIYQFDIIVVDIDMSIAYKDSGVCIMSHRAGFETALFNAKLLRDNYELVIEFLLCFNSMWLLFFIFNVTATGVPSFDQAGKDFMNAIRSLLSLTIYKAPKWRSFKIYLFVSIWCFFIFNFAFQAAIISFFTTYKRGRDVDTFEDVIEKGYPIEGLGTPDSMLPDTEERFLKINSKLVAVLNFRDCVDRILNDSRRFCLLDCSVGRYLAKNTLNENGEQYLHIAQDRIHSYYLNMMLHKHSPLTKTFNKYLRIFFESGLIMKWEQYRYNDVKAEVPIKALTLEDLIGIFKCYYLLLGLSFVSFVVEVLLGLIKRYLCLRGSANS